MQANEKISKETSTRPQNVCKKVYQKPHLEILGDLRAVTLAGSSGMGESGSRGNNIFPHPFIDPNTGQPK